MHSHLVQIAKKLAHDAGQLALKYQAKGFTVRTKDSPLNMVTDADEACEALIVKTIKSNFPDHTIISEESGITKGEGEYKWIVDPIDGTTNFIHGVPIFAISIAVIKAGKPIIGVVEIPGMNESFWAHEGKGAFLNEQKIEVSKVNDIKASLLATGFPYDRNGPRFKKAMELHEKFYQPSHGIRRMGSAAIDLCYVAAGRYDGYWEYGLKTWDVAAGKIILEEAGGKVTNMDGGPLDPKKEAILATNTHLHPEMLRVIKELGGDRL